MSKSPDSRRQKLEAFVAANPADAFARYGLALECANSGDHEAALGHLRELVSRHPGYVAGYQQLGILLAKLARMQDARRAFAAGIAAAQKAGNAHARDEMQAALDSLGTG